MKTIIACICLLLSCSLQGEISKVTVKWKNPGICLDSCITDMAKHFGSMNGAAEVILNQGGGQVDIRWKPRIPFSYSPINTAMRMVGPSIHEMRVSVRGTVTHSSNTFILESLGDNTKFVLLGPVNPSMSQYTVVHNTDNRPLSEETRMRFLKAEKNFEVVEIEGPLLDPWRYQVLYLIVEKANAISLGSQPE